MSIEHISDLRREYRGTPLLENEVAADPFQQFGRWFQEALNAEVTEPNAMTLATVDPDGAPSVRVVLLKGFDATGFTFFTNYGSKKGHDLAHNPRVSLGFWWAELARQVRIDGHAEKISREASAEYFESRPRASQIGAWASTQSSVIEGREVLTRRVVELEARFKDAPVPLPEYWGGYLVTPTLLEFWQGQASRLHDRLEYRLHDGDWRLQRLSP